MDSPKDSHGALLSKETARKTPLPAPVSPGYSNAEWSSALRAAVTACEAGPTVNKLLVSFSQYKCFLANKILQFSLGIILKTVISKIFSKTFLWAHSYTPDGVAICEQEQSQHVQTSKYRPTGPQGRLVFVLGFFCFVLSGAQTQGLEYVKHRLFLSCHWAVQLGPEPEAFSFHYVHQCL